MSEERRYSSAETALILRRALEHRASIAGGATGAAEGVTLAQLVAAAEEAGIPAEQVRRAAADLDRPAGLRASRWLGSPTLIVEERRVARTVAREEFDAFLDAVREEFGMLGVSAPSPNAVRWSSLPPGARATDGRRLAVVLRSGPEGTVLRVEEGLQPDVAGYFGLGTGVGITGGLLAVGILGSIAPVLALAAPVVPLGAYGAARTLLRRTHRARAAELERVASRLAALLASPLR